MSGDVATGAIDAEKAVFDAEDVVIGAENVVVDPENVAIDAENAAPAPARGHMVRAARWVVTLGLLGALAWLVVHRDGVGALRARVHELEPRAWMVAFALQAAAAALAIARFKLLLGTSGIRLHTRMVARIFLEGRFVAAFTPSTVGLDLYRIVAVARATGERARATMSILLEKAFGLVGMGLVTLALLPFGATRYFGTRTPLLAATLAAAGFAIVVAATRPSVIDWLGRLRPLRPLVQRLDRVRRPPSPAAAAAILGLGVGGHLAIAATYAATARALGLDVELGPLLLVGNVIVLSTLLPISIGGIGVREGVAVALLGEAGVAPADAVLVALLGWLATQPPALIGGLSSLVPRDVDGHSGPAAAPTPRYDAAG